MKVKTMGLPHQSVAFQMVSARMRNIVSSDTLSTDDKLAQIKIVMKQLETMVRENGKFYAILAKTTNKE